MLERLADLLRAEDSRSGFEANADMLSITGMTLEQFANLMEGLGYSAEKAEREKIKTSDNSESTEVSDQETSNIDPQNKESTVQPKIMEDQGELTEEKDIETFYTFKWISKQINNRRSERDKNSNQKDGETAKPKYKRKENKKQKVKADRPKSFEARPKKEHKIDPDNPFAAALMDFSKKN
jgi:ATP-dependent RNA helicase SUPV3L1/SUV3